MMSCECEELNYRRTATLRKDRCKSVRFIDEHDLAMAMARCKHEIEERRKRDAEA